MHICYSFSVNMPACSPLYDTIHYKSSYDFINLMKVFPLHGATSKSFSLLISIIQLDN